MIELVLKDITCTHCEKSVTQAVQQADPSARIEIDLDHQIARIESAMSLSDVIAVLTEAGYPPSA
jgi:copper chaperone